MIGCKIFNNWLHECYKLIQMKMHDNKLKFIGPKVWDPYITQIMAYKEGIIWVIFACLHESVWNISCTELLLYPHRFVRGKTAKIRWIALLELLSEKESIVSFQFRFIDRRPQSRMSIMEIILTGDAEDILSHTAVNSLFRGFSPAAHCVWFIVLVVDKLAFIVTGITCVFSELILPEHRWVSRFPLISPNQIHGVFPRLMGGWN